MRHPSMQFSWFLLGAAISLGVSEAKELRAGAAKVEIKPPTGITMAGYGARTGNARGVLDSLYAKVLVLEGKDRSVGFVTLDLVSVLPTRQLDQIRQRVKASTGIEDVIFNASHTHSGPALMDDPPEWQARLASDIAAGLEQAWKARRDARLGIGLGSVLIGHNRLFYMSNGTGKMLWRNETRLPTAPVDPTVMVIRLEAMDGSPIAILVNYACHPVVLGPENLDYSADYPGEMARNVEAAAPGTICLFVQGGAGDINPYYDKTPLADDAVGLMRSTGQALAKEVLRVLPTIRAKALPDAELLLSREILEVPARWNQQKMLSGVDAQKLSADARMRLERATRGPYQAPVTTMLLGRELAFVGVPAEIFVDYQIDARSRFPGVPMIFAGYTNGSLGYVPTIKGAVDGGYGANQLGSFLEVGAGSRMIDSAIIRLGYWTGKLLKQPATPAP